MDKKEFKKTLQESVQEYHFVYKNKQYYYCGEKLIVVLHCQKSDYENAFYINFGFQVKDLHGEGELPSITSCDVRGRFSCLINNEIRHNFCLDSIDKEILRENIKRNMNDFVIPVIEKGIREYFKRYPQALCTAKLALREYLNNE